MSAESVSPDSTPRQCTHATSSQLFILIPLVRLINFNFYSPTIVAEAL